MPVSEKVSVATFPGKGRGLLASCDLAAGELICCAPVKVLNPFEFQMLRLMPALTTFIGAQGNDDDASALDRLLEALQIMLESPAEVLAGDHKQATAEGAIMYTFLWKQPEDAGGNSAAIAFGEISLCNHAKDEVAANASITQNDSEREIELFATKDIGTGEEILIRYQTAPFELE